jgi:hypothetical protein
VKLFETSSEPFLGSLSSNHNFGVTVERFDLLVDEIPTHLEDFFAVHEQENPQLGLPWLQNLSRYSSKEGDTASIFVAYGEGNDLVALPLLISSNREARTLGNFYTSLAAPVTSGSHASSLLSALFSHLLKEEKAHTIVLSPLDRQHSLYPVIIDTLRESGWSGVHDFFCFANWIEHVQGITWEHYFRNRPSKLKNTIKRKTKAFLRDGKGELKVICGGAELASAIEQYTHIYANSWKNSEPHPDFMPQLIQLAARKGWLRLGIATYEGNAIASQVWLVAEGTAYIFKLAYHQKYAQLSAGTLLTAHLMRHVIEQDKVSTVDYLSGDDSYKRDWMSSRRERFGIAAFSTATISGCVKLLGYKINRLAKRLGLRGAS